MRLPLKVVEKLTRTVLVDADGAEIAQQTCYDWHGVPRANQPDTVRHNLTELAEAANSRAVLDRYRCAA